MKCSKCKRRPAHLKHRYCKLCRVRYDRAQRAKWTLTQKKERYAKTLAWVRKNRARVNVATRARYRKLRERVISKYGGKCLCCGESRFQFLAIDHINGGGRKHRETVGGSMHIATWLIKNKFPKGFRVLCHNCNMAIGFYGVCPHETEKKNAS